jgi:hypothetical protein
MKQALVTLGLQMNRHIRTLRASERTVNRVGCIV